MNKIDRKGWRKVRFGEVCNNLNVATQDAGAMGIDRYVGLEHIESGNLHISSWGNVADGTTFTKTFKPGHVLFGKRRAYLKKAAVADFKGLCSSDILVFEANEDAIEKRLLPFLVSSDRFFDFAVQTSAGSLSPRTKFQDLAKFEFLLPPKDQQAKLAELLWAADNMIESYSATQNKNNNCILSAYSDYFTKADVEFTSLGKVAEIIMGQSPDGSTYNTNGVGMPLLNGPTEFTERYPIKVQWTTKAAKLCKEGDILICVRGSTTGRMNISNDVYCIGRGIAAIRGNDKNLTEFIEHVLSYFVADILKLTTGSTFPNIDSKSLKEIRIPNYSLKKQTEIVGKIKLLIDAKDSLSSLIERSKQIQKQLVNQIFSA